MKKFVALALAALALSAHANLDIPWPGKENAAAAKAAEVGASGSARQAASAASATANDRAKAKAEADRAADERKKAEEAAGRAEAAATAAKKLQQSVARAAPMAGAQASAAGPSSYSSLQPFRQFAAGEGEGYAREYRPRTKAQFVALLRNPQLAKKEMRVTCDVLVRQMAEAHKLPFEGCEGAAAAIERDNDYAVVACRDGMFTRDAWLTVTNARGSAFGVWHRACLAGEQILTYKGVPIVSLTCLNPVIPVSQAVVTAPPLARPTPIGQCPEVYVLKLNVWTPSVLRLPGVAQTVAKEAMEVNGFSNPADFSRSHSGQVRKAEAAGNPDAKRSETPRRFRISFINTDEAKGGSSAITAEEPIYDVTVTGLIEMRFTRAELEKWDAIRTVSLDHDVQSPPTFGKTGLHELRFFNRLPGKKLGEWDNNPVPDCIMNEHTIEFAQPVPPLRAAATQ